MNKVIAAKLTKAQHEVHGLGKDATNAFHKYAYTSAESMITYSNGVLCNNGLGLFRQRQDVVMDGQQAYLMATYQLIDLTGESEELTAKWPVCPDKGRPLDKAVAAADTTCLAYTLRDLLKIPRVEHEVDADDEPPPRQQQRQTERPPERHVEANGQPKQASMLPQPAHTTGPVGQLAKPNDQEFRDTLVAAHDKVALLGETELGDTWGAVEADYLARHAHWAPDDRETLRRAVREGWLRGMVRFIQPSHYPEFRAIIKQSGLKSPAQNRLLALVDDAELRLNAPLTGEELEAVAS